MIETNKVWCVHDYLTTSGGGAAGPCVEAAVAAILLFGKRKRELVG
jgi:hypothetical protein